MFFAVLSIPLAPLYAAAPLPQWDQGWGSGLHQPPPRRVAQVVDQLRLLDEEGRIIALSSIDIPVENGGEPGDEALAAKNFLEKIFENPAERDIVLYQSATRTGQPEQGRTNRLGQDLAQMVRKQGQVWVQGALVANGLARARPTPASPELAEQLYALEERAMQEKLGLWAEDSPYRLLHADEIIENLNRFAVVEGIVRKVSTVNNVTYLNFGHDWKTDFTVGIPAATRQIMARQGIDVFRLQGKKLRVRGWIRAYNGPYIELEHPVLLRQEENGQDSTPE